VASSSPLVRQAAMHRGTSKQDDEADRREEHALGAVYGDADPGAAVTLRRVGEDELVEQRRRDRPRRVKGVGTKKQPARDPGAAPERAVHSRQQQPTEEQFLTEHGSEDEQDKQEAVPAPGAVHKAPARGELKNAARSRLAACDSSGVSPSAANAAISG